MSERSHKSRSAQRYEVTDGFRENYEAIFGGSKPQRGRLIWDSSRREYVPAAEYRAPEAADASGRVPVVTDLYMDGTRATDGTDIGSRRKRREYMQQNGLADASDYEGVWAKAEKERERFFSGAGSDRRLEETIGRAMYEAERKR